MPFPPRNDTLIVFAIDKDRRAEIGHDYLGSINIDHHHMRVQCDKLKGDRDYYLKGTVNQLLARKHKELGNFIVYKNVSKNKVENSPDFRGKLNLGEYLKYEMSVWLKVSKTTGKKFLRGTVRILDPEMKQKANAVNKASAPMPVSRDF